MRERAHPPSLGVSHVADAPLRSLVHACAGAPLPPVAHQLHGLLLRVRATSLAARVELIGGRGEHSEELRRLVLRDAHARAAVRSELALARALALGSPRAVVPTGASSSAVREPAPARYGRRRSPAERVALGRARAGNASRAVLADVDAAWRDARSRVYDAAASTWAAPGRLTHRIAAQAEGAVGALARKAGGEQRARRGAALPLRRRASPSPAAPTVEALPPGWHAATDAATGRTYYWDEASRAATWTHPSKLKGRHVDAPASGSAAKPLAATPEAEEPQPRRGLRSTLRSRVRNPPGGRVRRSPGEVAVTATYLGALLMGAAVFL